MSIGPAKLAKVTQVSLCQRGISKLDTGFFIAPSQEEKMDHLGLNSHLKDSLAVNLVKDQLWFADYLSEEHCDDVSTITVHLKAFHSHQTCNPQDCADSAKAKKYLTLDRPTHVIYEVISGFNAVFVFAIPFESANKMYLQAKKIFSNINSFMENPQSMDDVPLIQMASFRFYTDLHCDGLVQNDGFFSCLKAIWSFLHGHDKANFVPVEIALCPLISMWSRAPLSRDMEPDVVKKLFSLKHNLKQVLAKCKLQIEDEFLERFPSSVSPLLRLEEFKRCLEAIDDDISRTIASKLVAYRRFSIGTDDILQVCRDVYINFFLGDVLMEWLLTRQNEILHLKFLLENINLPFHTKELEMEELDPGQYVESFVFKIVRVEDPLISSLKERLCLEDGAPEEWPTFQVLIVGPEEQILFLSKLQSFCNQAYETQCDVCFIASESLGDGTVRNLSRPHPPLSFPNSPSVDEEILLAMCSASLTSRTNPQLNESSMPASSIASLNFEMPEPAHGGTVEEKIVGAYKSIYKSKRSSIAQDFVAGSRLFRDGYPAEYLLQADVKSSSCKKLRWLTIGKPNEGATKPHKVIVLMGATGAGKSTLINGMANYILGVEWSDPFRFRIVDDVAHSKHLSQTSSVTAYTIHHKDGMKIEFDLTVVDTPGYGDARGVDHDQEIGRLITEFVSHPETIHFVNALCFVGRSTDRELTPSQEMILESFTEIFGNEVFRSCQLLVTFFDGGKPPIVEAFRKAAMPCNDKTCLPFQKFNNSALYASISGDGVNQISWEMGYAYFNSFFIKLQEMPARILNKIPQVERPIDDWRKDLEMTLYDIELQLDITLSKMDKMINFQQFVALGNRLDFEIEVEEPKITTVDCRPFWSYNCHNCSFSCIKSVSSSHKKELDPHQLCSSFLCSCPAAMHSVDDFEYIWSRVKSRKKIRAIKEEYDVAAGAKMTVEGVLMKIQQELEESKMKGISLLEKAVSTIQLLDGSTGLPLDVLVSDYVEMLKDRAKSPGDSSRIETLDELVYLMNSPKDVAVPEVFNGKRPLSSTGNRRTN